MADAAIVPNIMQQTAKDYPRLAPFLGKMAYKKSKAEDGRMLESYPVGEDYSFDPTRPAIEDFSDKTAPKDVAGDVVSHFLVAGPNADPRLAAYYNTFRSSMTPDQQARLQEQYQWAKDKEGEKRPFRVWAEKSGIPAYFRGYAFDQWPREHASKLYTPKQIAMFDEMNAYLKGK